MLQLQYLNTRLKYKHINNILDNYKIKYSGIKNEIELKINEMIKFFLKDILAFLENIEETSLKKKKLNNYDKMKSELDSARNQLKIKIYNEHKTKNELDLLSQENALLKVKIKSLNQKILNINNNLTNSNSNVPRIRDKSPFIKQSIKKETFMTPKLDIKGSLRNSAHATFNYSKKKNNSVEIKIRKEKDNNDNKNNNKIESSAGNGLNNSCIITKNRKTNLNIKKNKISKNRNDRINLKISLKKENESDYIKKKRVINFNKFVNNKNNNSINLNTNNSKFNSKNDIQLCPSPILSAMSNIIIDNKNERNNSNKSNVSNPRELKSHNNYSPNNSFELLTEVNTDYEEIGRNINAAIDEELRQLEQDEENINKLLEQINIGEFNDLFLTKNSGDSKFSSSD